jgi:hypothetical protein
VNPIRSTGPSTPANFRSDFASRVGRPPVQSPVFQTPVRPSPMTASRTSPVAIPRTSPLATNAPAQRDGYGEYPQREEFHEAAYPSPRGFPPPQIHQVYLQSHSSPQFHPPQRTQNPYATPQTSRSRPLLPPLPQFSPAPVEAIPRPPQSRHFPPGRAVTSAAVSARLPSSVIRLEQGQSERSHPYARREGERPGSRQFVAGLNAHGKTRR